MKLHAIVLSSIFCVSSCGGMFGGGTASDDDFCEHVVKIIAAAGAQGTMEECMEDLPKEKRRLGDNYPAWNECIMGTDNIEGLKACMQKFG